MIKGYRPFKGQAECNLEMDKHPQVTWITDGNHVYSVRIWDKHYAYIARADGSDPLLYKFKYDEALDKFTFMDGFPFGIKEA